MQQVSSPTDTYQRLLKKLVVVQQNTAAAPASTAACDDQNTVKGANPLPPVMTVAEAAELLRVNRKTLYEAIKHHKIVGVRRVGRSLRLSQEAVLEWLAAGQGCVPPHRRR